MNLNEPRLWTLQGFREDKWQRGSIDDVTGSNTRIILSLEDFLALPELTRRDAAERLGVELASGEQLEVLLPYLDQLPLVALAFPAFNDGRSYSKATLLRRRYGFAGALRATGDILIDQVPHMLRCGFSELEVRNQVAIARLCADNPGIIPYHYQPATMDAGLERYAWRRVRS
jgi:uncharacterized protein (DUF934 family)